MDISSSTVFIPGATSGIGLALALRFQAAGSTVIIGGRRTAVLERLRGEHGFDVVEIDMEDPASIARASAQVLADHPGLDAVVAMAGIMRIEDWHEPAGFLDSAERVITTNLLGPVRLIAAFIDHLRSLPEATIMTVSSGLAFVPLAATPSYNATKAGIHLLSESIRLQLADTGVHVMELVPPAVQTDLLPGQAESEWAMPLDAFADEVVERIQAEPRAREVLVDRVGFLRFAAERGQYDEVVATLNRMDVHGR